MEFDFLLDPQGRPITKTFRLVTEDHYEVSPYPYIKEVTSERVQADSLEVLAASLEERARQGQVMLKGLLDRPLHGESRAGHTDSEAPVQWLLLDLDFHDGWSSVDTFLTELNPEWSDVSYIWQYSASAGIRKPVGLRGHLWLFLDRPVIPYVLKQWLRERNLYVSGLCERLELTASGRSLRWPLDVTTCQNDKLIYIAPPKCEGFDDPIKQRIQLVNKAKTFAKAPELSASAASLDGEQGKKIDALRQQAGLKKSEPKFKNYGEQFILENPEIATVTGCKKERGFVYLNLNGGDSWGYFYPDEEKPELLYNFKDEPIMRLKAIVPVFYFQELRRRQAELHGADATPYVFREPLTDRYYNVIYKPGENRCTKIAVASSKDKLRDFMAQFGQGLPTPIEDWDVQFRPDSTEAINPKQRWLNMFKPTEYLQQAKTAKPEDKVPPIINRVLDSMTGNDTECKERFLNWLAVIFQKRRRAETSWVFHGVEGTGKGIFLSRVLRPLFGPNHVTEWTTQNFEKEFNAALENTLLLWFDEFRAADAQQTSQLMNKLNSLITEQYIPLRAMRQDTRMVPNYCNVIIATNYPDPLPLSQTDRRHNICPAQEKTLYLLVDEKRGINEAEDIENELPQFAAYLYHRPISEAKARKPVENQAREQMIDAGQTTVTQFFQALRQGNLEWFLDYLNIGEKPARNPLQYAAFEDTLRQWAHDALQAHKHHKLMKITRSDILIAYDYIIGPGVSEAKMARMCKINRLPLKRIYLPGNEQRTKGFEVKPNITKVNINDFKRLLSSKQKLQVIPGGKHEEG